jgi:hypothetical protein
MKIPVHRLFSDDEYLAKTYGLIVITIHYALDKFGQRMDRCIADQAYNTEEKHWATRLRQLFVVSFTVARLRDWVAIQDEVDRVYYECAYRIWWNSHSKMGGSGLDEMSMISSLCQYACVEWLRAGEIQSQQAALGSPGEIQSQQAALGSPGEIQSQQAALGSPGEIKIHRPA